MPHKLIPLYRSGERYDNRIKMKIKEQVYQKISTYESLNILAL